MNWDDLRYVLALSKAGSLAKAARILEVDHTTVGRRIDALESNLGLRLFTRTTSGYVLTQEAERLLPDLQQVEASVLQFERCAHARDAGLAGVVRITSAETFGASYLASRLAGLCRIHPELAVELLVGPTVFDLARQEADVAVRFFRSRHEHLVVQKAADVGYALYAAKDYFRDRPVPTHPSELAQHDLLGADRVEKDAPTLWLRRVAPGARVVFTSNLTLALVAAAREGIGIALLPRYLGDAEPALRRIVLANEPRQAIWLTVHKDLQRTRRVRVVLDFLRATLAADAELLRGR